MVSIQIVAPPGSLSKQTEQRINRLIDARGLDYSVELVHDFETMIALGVYAIPGLLINGMLKSVGRVPEMHELIDWLDLDRKE
jgi:hypothetical protein